MRLSNLAQRRQTSGNSFAAEHLRELSATESLRADSIPMDSQISRPVSSVRIGGHPFREFTLLAAIPRHRMRRYTQLTR
jgi:hypothetical protein